MGRRDRVKGKRHSQFALKLDLWVRKKEVGETH